MSEKTAPISIRFESDDRAAIEKAAKLEGLDMSAYVRRCVITTTRKEHPELFPKLPL
jgi:uncharacterized protein (DUF1778 family)